MQVLPLKVLVVEDHFFHRAVAVNLLKQLGCQDVFSACNGIKALEILQRVGSVDIVLCDLREEEMGGLEFLHHAARAKLVGAVILSSSMSKDLRQATQKLMILLGIPLLEDLCKPLQADVLRRVLNKYLNEPEVAPTLFNPVVLAGPGEVRLAIRNQQMETYFQPKINLVTNDVLGVEALTRWNHPALGVVSPAVFMPAIESGGLLNELLFSQIRQGLELAQRAARRGYILNIAFNLKPVQLSNPELVPVIKRILANYNIPATSLTFELTENGLLEVSAICLESLVRLRMLGCQLSIDDFGVGYSSLQRLCQLPISEIKLDREFVQGLGHDPRCDAVINCTLELGRTTGISVVIEGIETLNQYRRLLDLGCVLGQGFFFAAPMPEHALLAWLSTRGASAKCI